MVCKRVFFRGRGRAAYHYPRFGTLFFHYTQFFVGLVQISSLLDEIRSHIGNQLGIEMGVQGLHTLIWCYKTDTVKIKNRVQMIVEEFLHQSVSVQA